MAEIRLGKNESLDTALKRFKRSCARDGVLAEVRKREHYEKPSGFEEGICVWCEDRWSGTGEEYPFRG